MYACNMYSKHADLIILCDQIITQACMYIFQCVCMYLFSLSICISMNTCHFYVLPVVILQWTWWCMYLFVVVLSFSLDNILDMEFLGHMIISFFIFSETFILFFIEGCTNSRLLPLGHRGSFSISLGTFISSCWWPF